MPRAPAPMAALVATLVTIGLMTKNSELVVMRACGISLYRTAAPLLLFAPSRFRTLVFEYCNAWGGEVFPLPAWKG